MLLCYSCDTCVELPKNGCSVSFNAVLYILILMNCEYEMVLNFNKSLSCIMAMACADAKATLIAEECIGACKHRIANITKIDLSFFFLTNTMQPKHAYWITNDLELQI